MRSSLYNVSVMVLGGGEHHTRLHLHAKTDQGHELMATKLGVRGFGRAMANEKKYPHIVELAVSKIGLDPGLARRIMNFHNSQHIRPRHGSINFSDSEKMYYRWCFSDLQTAHAECAAVFPLRGVISNLRDRSGIFKPERFCVLHSYFGGGRDILVCLMSDARRVSRRHGLSKNKPRALLCPKSKCEER